MENQILLILPVQKFTWKMKKKREKQTDIPPKSRSRKTEGLPWSQ